jgi:SAM-dependent methyltransferase
MSNPTGWARGYPVAEPYPPAWHSFQSPAHLAAIAALMGVAWEVGPETPLSVCEVGSGTGYTANVLAAGSPDWQVLGLDYNPAHVAEARSLAAAAGLPNVRFLEADLAELDDAWLGRLPEFDLVTIHGVWSWVSDPVREGILKLIRRRLKPGGIAMISYNALPGAGAALGLARLARGALLSSGSTEEGVEAARGLVKRLIAAEALHLPSSTWRTAIVGDHGPVRSGYLLHEFLTEHWRPAFHADVADALGSAGCAFLGSATIDENFPQMTLSAAQLEIWRDAPDEAARQLVIDLCVPRAFRRDIFVRGLRRIPADPAVDRLVLASTTHAPGEAKLASQAGEAALPPHLINPVREALAAGPRSVAELRALPGCGRVAPAELLALLIGSGVALPLWRRPGTGQRWEEAVAAARRLNTAAAARLAPHGFGPTQLALATPAVGGGLGASALELATAIVVAGMPLAGQEVPPVPSVLARLLPPGAEPPPEVMAELGTKISALLTERLPVWRALGIV